ncbi:MAG: FAD-dependent oxidoreductase [Sphaerochaetaceae bacterium]
MNERRVDVLVVGGGVSGVCAAIAAARCNVSVLLVEATSFLGGITTEGPLEALMTFHDEQGQIIAGIAQDIVDRLIQYEGSPGFVSDTVGYCRSLVPYDSEVLKKVLFDLLAEAGVTILLNSLVTEVKRTQKGIYGMVVTGTSSNEYISCDVVIDASGGADAARLAGAEVLFGREPDKRVQPMSTLCKVAGVDIEKLRSYVKQHTSTFKLALDADLDMQYLHLWGFRDILEKGYASGALSLRRSELQLMVTPRDGVVVINFSRFNGDPRVLEDISKAQMETLTQCHEVLHWLQINIEAFADAHIVHTGHVGIRESRRVRGLYELQPEDITKGKKFNHIVARGVFPIDIHDPLGDSLMSKKVAKAYGIPMESLISANIPNLFMAGRCICASHEALASARITATAMATGQASGVMAALKAQSGVVDYAQVKALLEDQKVLL